MRRVCVAGMRRVRVGFVAFAVSFVAIMSVGVAAAAACAWTANPSPGTPLYVRSQPSTSSPIVGSMSYGTEFYGSCSTIDGGWIEVEAGAWRYYWDGIPPFDYVNSRYAIKS
jgi:uncharacterized protein YraI